jgi:hypothetical protein
MKAAGIDVHKSMLAVVVTEVGGEGEPDFERRKFGTVASQLREPADWLAAAGVREVVMESTAQYGKPVWHQLEGHFRLYLAQAQSNRSPRFRRCGRFSIGPRVPLHDPLTSLRQAVEVCTV